MPSGRKFAIAAPVAGLAVALAFRGPDNGGKTTRDVTVSPSRVTRRLGAESGVPLTPAPFRLAPHSDLGFSPPPAATGAGPAEIASIPPSYDRLASPVGSLLEPLESEPAALASAPESPAAESRASNDSDSTVRRHCVVDGDTLGKLAAHYLGSVERYREIFELNRDQLKTPDLLPIGKTLKIPSRNTPAAAGPIVELPAPISQLPATPPAQPAAGAWRPGAAPSELLGE